MMTRYRAAALVLALVAGFAPAVEPDPAIERLRKDIFFLAGEECEGRGVETQGILKAGEYVADVFRTAGLKPAGVNGTYFQPFEIAGSTRLGTPNTLKLAGPDGQGFDLKYGTDFTTTGMSGSGKAAAGLAFVGYGISADKLKYDDYAGLDVRGKYLVMLRRTPRAENKDKPFDPDPASNHQALGTKLQLAAKHGAAGVIFVNDATYGRGDDVLMDYSYRGATPVEVPVFHVKREALRKVLAAAGKDLAQIEKGIDTDLSPRSFTLAGWMAEGEAAITKVIIPARNVVAVAEGAGPLADETIVIGAHYDHLGKGEVGSLAGKDAKGKVHYGADDNASGTTGLLELARRFGAMKDRIGRRIVFIAFSGEERGLFGSIHYCKSPSFPLDKTVFMLNMDMIGRVTEVDDVPPMSPASAAAGTAAGANPPKPFARKDRVVVYGTGTGEGIDDLVTQTNKKFDFKILRIPGGTGPSDHDSFYRKKVPVLFFFTGTHRDYHRPTDTPDRINLAGMKKVVDMAESLAAHFAAQTDRPKYLVTKGGWEDPTQERPKVSRPAMPRLGIMPGNYEAMEGGVLVEDLTPGGAAEKAGLKAKDVVVEIAGKPVKNINEYMAVMAGQKPGHPIDVVVIRQDKKLTIKVTPLP